MSTRMSALIAQRRSTRPTSRRANSIRSNLALESCAGSRQRVSWDILVHMHSLRMLSQIVEAREPARAMTLEWALASVLSIGKSAYRLERARPTLLT